MGNFDPDKIQPVTTAKTKLGLNTNIAALLCYVPLAAINLIAPALWLVSEPKNNYFLRFHSAQALVLTLSYVGVAVVLFIGSTILHFIPLIGSLFGLLTGLVGILVAGAFFLTSFFLMYAAFNNRLVKLPVIGALADRLLTAVESRP